MASLITSTGTVLLTATSRIESDGRLHASAAALMRFFTASSRSFKALSLIRLTVKV
jgi:hypothetical protein